MRTGLPDEDELLGPAFDAHRRELAGHARRVLGDAHLAEEVVQETFARAWRARHRFDPEVGSLRTWLFSIERNLLVDLGRARARRELPAPVEPAGDSVPDRTESVLTSWQVETAIGRLTPEHRTVLVAVYFRGHTSREVAGQLGLPEGTVRSRLYYALRSLRETFESMGWER